jgi:hypothetical protein
MNARFHLTALLALAVLGRAVSPASGEERALDPARFFANPTVQALAPGAFAVQAESVPVLEKLARVVPAQRAALVAAIRADAELAGGIAQWGTLGWPRQKALLERLVALEARVFGVQPPILKIHEPEEAGPGPAYFEFDTEAGGTGTVHLWPSALAEEPSPHAAVMLAIHETRHSWQFQVAFGAKHGCDSTVKAAFAAGFRAQKALNRKLSFCDFCTMHHEHEAFETGNQVIGELTGWTADTQGMGCWSSQFDAQGAPRIDLLALAREFGPQGLTAAFNERERGQFVEMGGR